MTPTPDDTMVSKRKRVPTRIRASPSLNPATMRNPAAQAPESAYFVRNSGKAKELFARDAERKRRAGGQPGHEGAGRPLEGEHRVDEFVDHYPDSCQGCGHEFADDEKVPSRRPGRRQVAELPPTTVVISEHRAQRLRCPACQRKTAARFPADVAASLFGPRLQAAVVTLTARNRVSRRDMSELARELFGIRLSVGTVDAICRRAANALAEPHEALVSSVLQAP
ncbi:MAG: IS66 family transposase, partial [Actinobacteria bacterium]